MSVNLPVKLTRMNPIGGAVSRAPQALPEGCHQRDATARPWHSDAIMGRTVSATIEPHPSRVYTEMNGYQDITGILLDLLGFTSTFADIPGSIACELITLVPYSYMVLFERARDFFSRFLESRNYKIQMVARVGRKSDVAPSGLTGASYPRFFIGIDSNCVDNRNLAQ